MASFRSDGDKLDYTPTTGVAAGDIVVLGSLVTMADRAIAANDLGAVLVRGVVTGPCLAGATGAQGSLIRWHSTTGVFHDTTGTSAGYLARARVATDTIVQVLLWPGA
jgi:predicted RecA/RadA family phage recombinase